MTDKQPETLRLAERCEWFARTTGGIESAFVGKDMLMEAAAKLRRLHEENEVLGRCLFQMQEAAKGQGLTAAKATGENND